ncbi:DUF5667 domain-containing protein [Patescibacteria group bacterium]
MQKKLFSIILISFCMIFCVGTIKAQEIVADEANLDITVEQNETAQEDAGMTAETEATETADTTTGMAEETTGATEAPSSEQVAAEVKEMTEDIEAQAIVDGDVNIEAEDFGISEPTMLPDSPWYFTKSLWRGVKSAVTFNPIKKAELKLQFANEKLIETKKLAEKTGATGAIENALESYQNEVDKVKEKIDNIKETVKENPNVDKFLDKLADHQIKQKKLLDKLEEKMPEKTFAKIQEAKDNVMENLGNALNKLDDRKEKITERLEKIIENQDGSKFKDFKNIEILKEIEDRAPEEAKEAIQKAQKNTMANFQIQMGKMENKKEDLMEFQKYIGAIGGDQTRHLEILNDFKQGENVGEGMVNIINEVKLKPLARLRYELETLPNEEARGQFLNNLQDGEMGKMQIMKEIENSLPPEMQNKIKIIKENAFKVFENKMKDVIKDPERRKEFFENMPPPPIEQLEMMDEMKDFVTPENMAMIQEIKEKSMDKFKEKFEEMEGDPEQQKMFMKKMMGAPAPMFMDGNMDRLRAMKEMENNLPDEIQKKMEPMKNMFMENFQDKMEDIENNPEKRKIFFDNTMNPDAKHFEVMEELDNYMPYVKDGFMEEMKEKAFEMVGEELKNMENNPDQKEKFIERFAGDDMQHFQVLERVQEKLREFLPDQAKAPNVLQEVIERQTERMKEKAQFIEDPERFQDFRKELETGNVNYKLKQELMKDIPKEMPIKPFIPPTSQETMPFKKIMERIENIKEEAINSPKDRMPFKEAFNGDENTGEENSNVDMFNKQMENFGFKKENNEIDFSKLKQDDSVKNNAPEPVKQPARTEPYQQREQERTQAAQPLNQPKYSEPAPVEPKPAQQQESKNYVPEPN